jgi:hypothetical protein
VKSWIICNPREACSNDSFHPSKPNTCKSTWRRHGGPKVRDGNGERSLNNHSSRKSFRVNQKLTCRPRSGRPVSFRFVKRRTDSVNAQLVGKKLPAGVTPRRGLLGPTNCVVAVGESPIEHSCGPAVYPTKDYETERCAHRTSAYKIHNPSLSVRLSRGPGRGPRSMNWTKGREVPSGFWTQSERSPRHGNIRGPDKTTRGESFDGYLYCVMVKAVRSPGEIQAIEDVPSRVVTETSRRPMDLRLGTPMICRQTITVHRFSNPAPLYKGQAIGNTDDSNFIAGSPQCFCLHGEGFPHLPECKQTSTAVGLRKVFAYPVHGPEDYLGFLQDTISL